MSEQGFRIARMMITAFTIIILAGLGLIAGGLVDVTTLTAFFDSVSGVASVFGIQAILAAYIVSRGQTSNSE